MYRILKLNESEVKEYRYITNHGIGPGTVPEGTFVRSEDLENGKTAIYLNRPLTDEELKKYDIKPEWIQESTLTEAPEDEEELEVKAEEDLENEEEVEDTIDTEEDQEENPVEEESELDKELDELRSVLVDLDLNLYRIARKEDTNDVIYIIGKVAEDSNDVLMLVSNDIQNGDDLETDEPIENTMDNIEKEVVDDIVKESSLNESDEVPYSDEVLLDEPKEEEEEKPTFDFVKLPVNFDEINKLSPRYGDGLTPNHEAIMDYLMNCLIEVNPEAAEELQSEKELEEPINPDDDKVDLDIDIGEEEEEE